MKKLLLGLLALSPALSIASTGQVKQTISVEVTDKGFVPNSIDVKPGTDVTLAVTRKTEETCATEILVPSKKIKHALPLNETVTVALGKLEKGEVKFGCGMNLMESARVLVH